MDLQLTAQARTKTGKGIARKLRQQFMVPAVCYGPHIQPQPLALPVNELEKLVHHLGDETKIIPLTVKDDQGEKLKHVMIREIQTDPIKRKILHVDFYEVSMDEPIVIDVPIELTGEPEGVKKGGLLNQIRHAVSVRCLPSDIPERIVVDVSSLDIGESIHIEDLKSQVGFELVDEDHFTLVTIGAPTAEREAASEEEEEIEPEGEEVTEE